MGYIDNTLVTIDAIVTKKGRDLLSKGRARFKVTKFAVADDEIDYRLWDTKNSNGSVYYGQAIENMSLIEANPNQDATMRFKMISLPKNIEMVPTMALAGGNYSPIIQSISYNPYSTEPLILVPVTYNPSNANAILGYTATILDASVLTMEPSGPNSSGGTNWSLQSGNTIYNLDTNKNEVKATGTSFIIYPMPISYNTPQKECTVTIVGNETAGKLIVNVTVLPPVSAPGGGT